MTRTLSTEEEQILTDFRVRRKNFSMYLNEFHENDNIFTCPSCGYPTLTERWGWEICDICNWEDDGSDDGKGEDEPNGGPNQELSLTDSRLQIGKELNELAEKLNGTLITDPAKIVSIIERHQKRMEIISNKNNSLRNEWAEASELIKKEIIEVKK